MVRRLVPRRELVEHGVAEDVVLHSVLGKVDGLVPAAFLLRVREDVVGNVVRVAMLQVGQKKSL